MDAPHPDRKPGTPLVRPVAALEDLRAAAGLLRDAEEHLGAPLVDEAEHARLDAALDDGRLPDEGWRGWLAASGGLLAGYAGLGPSGRGDIAAAPGRSSSEVLGALAAAVAEVGAGLQVWVRHASPVDVSAVAAAGWRVRRRLGVLGTDLDGRLPDPQVPDRGRIRAFAPGQDEDAVVAVLAEAYAGTDDGGWDHGRFAAKRELGWFDPADLLLAVEDGEVVALHWTKRRGSGVGEVYNLAVAPRGQGRGWGRALLAAGLRHLHERGCDEVILWVDRANERALSLYGSQGFHTRWDDVAFVR